MTDEARLQQAEKDIVRLQQQQMNMHQDLGEIKGVLLSQAQNIQDIRDAVMRASGGWKTLLAVGGFAGVVGSAVTTILVAVWPK